MNNVQQDKTENTDEWTVPKKLDFLGVFFVTKLWRNSVEILN